MSKSQRNFLNTLHSPSTFQMEKETFALKFTQMQGFQFLLWNWEVYKYLSKSK